MGSKTDTALTTLGLSIIAFGVAAHLHTSGDVGTSAIAAGTLLAFVQAS